MILLKCPLCQQYGFSKRGFVSHLGNATCQRRQLENGAEEAIRRDEMSDAARAEKLAQALHSARFPIRDSKP